MSQANFFQKRRPMDERRRISIRVDDVLQAGTAITRSTVDPAKGVAAVGDVLGFMIDPTVEGGPTPDQRGMLWGKELSLPDVAGDLVTLDPPYDAYECEGPQYICLSGTGAIDNTTVRGTVASGFISRPDRLRLRPWPKCSPRVFLTKERIVRLLLSVSNPASGCKVDCAGALRA